MLANSKPGTLDAKSLRGYRLVTTCQPWMSASAEPSGKTVRPEGSADVLRFSSR